MNAQGVRIVVGEGRSSQHGLLRFVLDGEGYDVVADAANPAELARVLAAHRPDVVVLDDGIGATAVGMVREMVPGAKIVLVWPGDVVPIGGAAQVAPARVLQELGPAVARVTGVAGVTAASAGAALVDEARRDPDNLRRLVLGAAAAAATTGAIIVDGDPAPIVILPVTPSVGDGVVTVPEADEIADVASDDSGAMAGLAAAGVATAVAAVGTPAAATVAVGAQSALNRRLGNLALGGAAVAGAIVLALALGGAKVPIDQVSGEAFTFTPPVAPEPGGGSGIPPIEGNSNHGNDGERGNGNEGDLGSNNKLDFYPIQPYISSFLPESSLPPVAGGPIPPVETSGRRGGLNQHHRHANTPSRRHDRADNRGS